MNALSELFTWPYILFFVRLLPALVIFRWNILGAFLFLVLDGVDYVFFSSFTGIYNDDTYHYLDKIFDQLCFTIQLVVVLKQWNKGAFKKTTIVMYFYRLIGLILFEVTKIKLFLVIFTNIFEYFYLAVIVFRKVFNTLKDNWKNTLLITLLLIPIKLFQELYIHTDIKLPSVEDSNLRIVSGIIGFVIVIYLQFFHKNSNKPDLEEEKS